MQRAGDVWRGYYQRIGNTCRGRVRSKVSFGDPEIIPVFFNTLWIEAFV